MKIVVISAKTVIARHWFKWYRVMRGATDWQPLKVQKRFIAPDIKKVQADLEKKFGKSELPPMLKKVFPSK